MQISMEMFMILMFFVGLILTIYAFKIGPIVNNSKPFCPVSTQNAVRGLLVMGVMILSVSGTYMVCGFGGDGNRIDQGIIGMSFVSLMLAIGIIVIVLTSTIHSACPDARKNTPVLMTLAVLTAVASGSYLSYRGYNQLISNTPRSKF